MENGSLYTTVETLTRIIVPPLYVLVGLAVYRWLMPHLSPASKRLANFMLAAQVLTISMSVYFELSSSFQVWLWHLHKEWNVPATLASTQMALVGGVALLCAWLSRSRVAFQRLYLFGIGLVFLFLAYDEYFTVHEYRVSWKYYIALGASVVAATLVVAARSPRQSWKWHTCLLAGLAISAAGAIHVEQFGSLCGDYGLLYIDECPPPTTWALEEILEFLGIWLTLVAMLGQFSDVSPPAHRSQQALYLMPALWIVVIVPSAPIWPIARQVGAQPAAVEFESGAGLHAYHIDKRKKNFTVRLFLSPERWDYDGLGYSIHLVDQVSADSIVSVDTYAHRRLEFSLGPGYVPVYRQWKRMEFPPHTPVNRALWVVLALWHKKSDKFEFQNIIVSDLQLLNDTQVVLGEFVLPAVSAATSTVPLAIFDNGFTLDTVVMPEHARSGENLTIPFSWTSDIRGREDHVQFLHFGHQESGTWWVYDQQPLGPRLPTRLWYSGLADSETWRVPLPADLAPGRYTIFTGLYRTRDQQRVPASDSDGTPWLDARVPLGMMTIGGA